MTTSSPSNTDSINSRRYALASLTVAFFIDKKTKRLKSNYKMKIIIQNNLNKLFEN
jgi:hypothetical protein